MVDIVDKWWNQTWVASSKAGIDDSVFAIKPAFNFYNSIITNALYFPFILKNGKRDYLIKIFNE